MAGQGCVTDHTAYVNSDRAVRMLALWMGRSTRSWIHLITTSGTMPRVPSLSMHRAPAPPVGGCMQTNMSVGGAYLQRRQRRTVKTFGDHLRYRLRCLQIQPCSSREALPHGRPYCGKIERAKMLMSPNIMRLLVNMNFLIDSKSYCSHVQ